MKLAKTKSSKNNWRPFDEARTFAHALGLKNRIEWTKWTKNGKRPNNIPIWPDDVYKNKGWAGWGDWLGTRRIANQNKTYRSFDDARAYARNLGLKNWAEWRTWATTVSRPRDIPSAPDKSYKNKGWIDWGDWLGTGRIASQ